MKSTTLAKMLVLGLVLVICRAGLSQAASMGTGFTYQGRLIDANNPADGLYDFQFKLYDANSDGNQIGGDANNPDIDVIDGSFAVELDFGPVFDGNERWLEIGVRPGELEDPNLYTLLSPRQEVTPTPYALHTYGLSVVGNNTFVGKDAGTNNTTGSGNTFSGYWAGYFNTAGYSNTFTGYWAGYSNTSGRENTFSGNEAGYSNTTGKYNSAVGDSALYYNTTGGSNSAMGLRALYYNTTGAANSAMGEYALYYNTTGNYNSAMGWQALYSNTKGGINSAMGDRALYSNTTGNYNSAVGGSALYYNTTGYENSAMGFCALANNTTGSENSAVGHDAGFLNSTGNGNVFLGYQAGYNETGSNKLYIANSSANPPLIYGDFSTGNVGIGTTSPAAKLEVAGQVKITGGSPAAGKVLTSDSSGLASWQTPTGGGDSDWIISGSNMYSGVSGNVGIGTTTLLAKLHVVDSTPSGTAVYGSSSSGRGVYGKSASYTAVYGENSNSGNYGSLGGNNYGVHGYNGTTGNYGYLGSSDYGAYGGTSTGTGVYGYNFSTGNYGYLGSSNYGVYGKSMALNGIGVKGEAEYFGVGVYGKGGVSGYAAEFHGKVRICDRDSGSTVMLLGKGLDYAEGFDVSEEDGVSPGTVLVIDRENPGKLAISQEAYDTKVAGIVAGAKGLTSGVRLGVEGFDCDVALAGRVYCNVDAAEYGIEPGDMLTTSDKPGYAMKAADHTRASGAILGKAMEPLEKGNKGQILVLVTLQ